MTDDFNINSQTETSLNEPNVGSVMARVEERGAESPDLGDATALATIRTFAETADIKKAKKDAAGVEPSEAAALAEAIKVCAKALRNSKSQEAKSRDSLYEGLAKILEAGRFAYEHPELLVALAAKAANHKIESKRVTFTAASWRAPFLVLIKLARPEIDDKTASFYGRALNYIAALGLAGHDAQRMLKTHGVSALAQEEAKRQRARKSGPDKGPAPDPVESLRRELVAISLPGNLELDGLPNDGEVGLAIIGRNAGQLVAWAAVSDEKCTAVVARRVLKRKKAASTSLSRGDADDS